MKQIKGYTYRLSPTPAQTADLERVSSVCRLVYNLALEQRRNHWRAKKRTSGTGCTFGSQAHELTHLRREFEFICDVPQDAEQRALKDLERAFDSFFAGRASYPDWRRRGTHETFRIAGRDVRLERLSANWAQIRLPKIGWIKYRDSYGGPDQMLSGDAKLTEVTVRLSPLGWTVSMGVKREVEVDEHPVKQAVGIDRGVVVPLALSNGELVRLPKHLKALHKQKKRAQRVLARRKKGSNRRAMAKARLTRLSAKIARVRKDWAHKETTRIADAFGYVVIEKLATANMVRSAKGTVDAPGNNVKAKAGLNREILNVGWHQIQQMLEYKLAWRGGHLEQVPPQYTSQTCSACGIIDKQSRESQARFICRHCGHEENADINAAKNILMRSNSPYLDVEACGYAACEASTAKRAA